MELKNLNTNDYFDNKWDCVSFVTETLGYLLLEGIDITSVSITVTRPEKSEACFVSIATA